MSEEARNCKVLIVEDNPDCQAIYKTILEHAGFEVVVVGTGNDAYAAVANFTPDLFVIDLHLVDERGEAVLAHLRTMDRCLNVPVIIMTADAIAARDYIASGVLDVHSIITKPASPTKLLADIEEFRKNFVMKC